MSGNDYVKFMTQEIVKYMDLPEDERKKRKEQKKQQEAISSRWFGMLPFALKFMFKKHVK
ncbi:hypothetical protein N780_16495 [Pontibacillus chungwhensis BH030062]|uniref:YqzE family protein n=1 Tax=Pontibacillus chungwhensis BH030062 TaxID=1385513 RepID=A0A0A2UVK4_9BACI|nr:MULTISPECIES: YqzE family protein [Pontibacillus]KGP91944.1 hypothetical protein N780_16495 [Pontibacillus chungwhensis BH030062]QSS98938.1 YqzE family protein [Pontibacillus sp. ALD_SL1]